MGSPFLIIERVAPERKKTLPPWPNTSSQPLSWLPSPSLTTTVPTLLPRVGMQLPAQPMPPLLPQAMVPQTPATELLLPNTPPTLTSSPMTLTRLPLTMVEISSICQRSSSCSHFSLPSLPPLLWPSSSPLSLAFSSTLRSAFLEAFSDPLVASRLARSTPSLHPSASPCAMLAPHLHKPLEGVLHQDSS